MTKPVNSLPPFMTEIISNSAKEMAKQMQDKLDKKHTDEAIKEQLRGSGLPTEPEYVDAVRRGRQPMIERTAKAYERNLTKMILQEKEKAEAKGKKPDYLAILKCSIMEVGTAALSPEKLLSRQEDLKDSCGNCATAGMDLAKIDKVLKKCSRCLQVKYCSTECQTAHWPTHKKVCKLLAANNQNNVAAPAHTAGWLEAQKDLKATTFQSARAYSPLKQPFSFGFDCLNEMFENLFLTLQAVAQQQQSAGKEINPNAHISINFELVTKDLEKSASAILTRNAAAGQEGKSDGKVSKQQSSSPQGLTSDERKACLQKAHETILKWVTPQVNTFPDGYKFLNPKVAGIFDKKWGQKEGLIDLLFYKQFGLRRSKLPVDFTEADLQAFGIKKGEEPSAMQLNGVAFALMRVGELRAKEWIFQGKEIPMKDLYKILRSWGYAQVDTPAPKDLVMYIDTDGSPKHLGCYLSSGRIESKFGVKQSYLHWHNVFDVPTSYGNRVVFLRKS